MLETINPPDLKQKPTRPDGPWFCWFAFRVDPPSVEAVVQFRVSRPDRVVRAGEPFWTETPFPTKEIAEQRGIEEAARASGEPVPWLTIGGARVLVEFVDALREGETP